MKQSFDIDFVIPWVDGNDPEWIKEFNKYCPEDKRKIDVSTERYRDYGLLKYWFRGVEKFAPWVRKIHFITCGQKPEWLNIDNPKLHWVKHEDYIPKEYLPVFSSHPIELYMHKIEGLAEHFVYFNDDLYLTDYVKPEFFFKKGLPCDAAVSNAISPTRMSYIVFNDLACINKDFNRNELIKSNFSKWMNLKYGKHILRNLFLLPWSHFTGFFDPHFARPFTKSLLEDAWNMYSEKLKETMNHKFRNNADVNQWLFRYLRLCKGDFYPQHPTKHKGYFSMKADSKTLYKVIAKQKFSEIVLNDDDVSDFEEKANILLSAFDKILPEKSTFEK